MHLGLSIAIALTFKDLGVLFVIIGATGCDLLMFILPGLFYFMIHYHHNNPSSESATTNNSNTNSNGTSLRDLSTHNLVSTGKSINSDYGSTINIEMPTSNGKTNNGDNNCNNNGAFRSRSCSELDEEYRNSESSINDENPRWKLYAAGGMLLFGILLMPLSLALILMP